MVLIKIWKDADGYGVQLDSDKFGMNHDDIDLLITELRSLQDEVIEEDGEGTLREIALGLEDE
jgi:hypothetical protein